jgi:chromosome partitioning protein
MLHGSSAIAAERAGQGAMRGDARVRALGILGHLSCTSTVSRRRRSPQSWRLLVARRRAPLLCGSVNIVVASLKGGVGKSTAAVYLAAAAAEHGHNPVVLVDADRQASSAVWLEERPVEGVEVIEAPSERILKRALAAKDGLTIVDTPPGDERLTHAAIADAGAVIVPTRAGGVEFARVAATLELVPARTTYGIVISSARLATNDLEETISWWRKEGVPVWSVVPERVAIAAGPEARLSREGLDLYGQALKRALRGG